MLTGLNAVISAEECTHRAAVHQGLDVGVALVAELLIVRPLQAKRSAVAVFVAAVGPGHRSMTLVRDALPRLNTQQPQKTQLHHTHGVSIRVHICELQMKERCTFII